MWFEANNPVREWLRTKYNYEPSTGVISDRASGAEVGGINSDIGYRFVMLYNPAIGLRSSCYGHRLAWFLHHGEWPAEDLDHINHQRADNRIENLRLCTDAQNAQNRLKPVTYGDRPCHSTYKGVTRHKRSGKWMARIQVEGKRIHLGEFLEEAEAAEAYRAAAAYHFGEFAVQASIATSGVSTTA